MLKPDYLSSDISDNEFTLFRDVIFRESGINLTERKKALMQSRLIKRLRVLKLDSYEMYYEYLTKNYENEIINLINCITTNKTDFFREPKHFEFLKKTALPEFEKSGGKKLRIWSAGCSTGEEAYSIAITVTDYYKGRPIPDIKILATDIDTVVLNTAISGIYKEEVLDGIDTDILKKYFIKDKDNNGQYIVKDQIKNLIYFRRLNLLNKVFPMKGKFDHIFCRNVIIYFDKKTKDEVVGRLYDYLTEGGYFFSGHSENLSNVCSKYHLIGNTVYSKRSNVYKAQQEI